MIFLLCALNVAISNSSQAVLFAFSAEISCLSMDYCGLIESVSASFSKRNSGSAANDLSSLFLFKHNHRNNQQKVRMNFLAREKKNEGSKMLLEVGKLLKTQRTELTGG